MTKMSLLSVTFFLGYLYFVVYYDISDNLVFSFVHRNDYPCSCVLISPFFSHLLCVLAQVLTWVVEELKSGEGLITPARQYEWLHEAITKVCAFVCVRVCACLLVSILFLNALRSNWLGENLYIAL